MIEIGTSLSEIKKKEICGPKNLTGKILAGPLKIKNFWLHYTRIISDFAESTTGLKKVFLEDDDTLKL